MDFIGLYNKGHYSGIRAVFLPSCWVGHLMQSNSKYYIRRRTILKGRNMGERQSQSPPRFPRVDDDETREFYRIMTTRQQEIAQSLQALTTIMERVV